jgi:hypothetical protein
LGTNGASSELLSSKNSRPALGSPTKPKPQRRRPSRNGATSGKTTGQSKKPSPEALEGQPAFSKPRSKKRRYPKKEGKSSDTNVDSFSSTNNSPTE